MFGHRSESDFDHHPVDRAEEAELDRIWREPRFQEALQRYTKRDPSQNIPYLAGSDNEGETVFEDREFAKYVHEGKFKYKGEPFDPTEFLILHEAVEGVLIRLYKFDYDKAHRLATIAERLAVEAAGYEWVAYQEAFKEPIARAEKESGEGAPRNLLAVAYEGSPIYRKIEANEGVTVHDSGISDEKAREAIGRSETPSAVGSAVGRHPGEHFGLGAANSPNASGGKASGGGLSDGQQVAAQAVKGGGKLSHAEAGYHADHGPGGAHCGICRFFQAGSHCRIVIDPIYPNDGCEHFKARGQEVTPELEQFSGTAAPKLPGPQVGAGKMAAKGEVHPQMSENPKPQTQVGPHVHALALGGLPHMLAGGHISQAEHDRIHHSARTALANHSALKGSGAATFKAGSGSHRGVNEPVATIGAMVPHTAHPGTGSDRGEAAPHVARPVGHGRNVAPAMASAGIPEHTKPAVPGSPLEPKRPRRFGSLASMGMY